MCIYIYTYNTYIYILYTYKCTHLLSIATFFSSYPPAPEVTSSAAPSCPVARSWKLPASWSPAAGAGGPLALQSGAIPELYM